MKTRNKVLLIIVALAFGIIANLLLHSDRPAPQTPQAPAEQPTTNMTEIPMAPEVPVAAEVVKEKVVTNQSTASNEVAEVVQTNDVLTLEFADFKLGYSKK